LRAGDIVLDVGCGRGDLGKAIMEAPSCPPGVIIKGLERAERDVRLIEIRSYDGVAIPHANATFDVVILADVLHHDPEPERLLRECIRVSRRLVILKDHQVKGLLARQRISLLDWAANFYAAIPCTYSYRRPEEWTHLRQNHGLVLIEEHCSMRLYPRGLNLIFGGALQYLAVLGRTHFIKRLALFLVLDLA
jgi:ubiquinone/menaquinone biosynthesis C-methylase UbiE